MESQKPFTSSINSQSTEPVTTEPKQTSKIEVEDKPLPESHFLEDHGFVTVENENLGDVTESLRDKYHRTRASSN